MSEIEASDDAFSADSDAMSYLTNQQLRAKTQENSKMQPKFSF